jgi:hypothetical protein
MLYREIFALWSEIHTKYINLLCGRKVELLNVKMAVNKATTKPSSFILFSDKY